MKAVIDTLYVSDKTVEVEDTTWPGYYGYRAGGATLYLVTYGVAKFTFIHLAQRSPCVVIDVRPMKECLRYAMALHSVYQFDSCLEFIEWAAGATGRS